MDNIKTVRIQQVSRVKVHAKRVCVKKGNPPRAVPQIQEAKPASKGKLCITDW
jgi:hypothetical protein